MTREQSLSFLPVFSRRLSLGLSSSHQWTYLISRVLSSMYHTPSALSCIIVSSCVKCYDYSVISIRIISVVGVLAYHVIGCPVFRGE